MNTPLLDQLLMEARQDELERLALMIDLRREHLELTRIARLEAALRVARQRIHSSRRRTSPAR